MPHVPPRPIVPPTRAPIVIEVKITSVEAPTAFQFAATGDPDPKTGVRNDLRDAENAATKAHAKLAETPILTLTTADGVPGVATTEADFPYLLTTSLGTPPDGGLRALTLRSRLAVTAHRLPSGFIRAKIAFLDTHAVGPVWRELSPPQTEAVSGSMDNTFKSGDTLFVAKIPADSPTGRFYFATVTILPPTKG